MPQGMFSVPGNILGTSSPKMYNNQVYSTSFFSQNRSGTLHSDIRIMEGQSTDKFQGLNSARSEAAHTITMIKKPNKKKLLQDIGPSTITLQAKKQERKE